MSKCLEFGPDQHFEPKKPQAEEIRGSQLWSAHPPGDAEQPQEVGKQEKAPRNSFHFFLTLLLFPPSFFFSSPSAPNCFSSNKCKACSYSEAPRVSRGEAAAEQELWGSRQKDVPGGDIGRLEPRGPQVWLRAPLYRGAIRAGLSPSQTRLLGLKMSSRRKKGVGWTLKRKQA